MFPSRVSVPLPSAPESEDIFSSGLSSLFTDDTQNSHGTPGDSVIYHSPRFGDITLRIPAHPDVEEGRRLFAHYLWNSGVIVADAIETASREHDDGGDGEGEDRIEWDARYWDMRGKRILELGAGTALPSLISALSGASSLTITDHPSSPALTTNAIEKNITANVVDRLKEDANGRKKPTMDVFGYIWGTTKMYMPSQYGKPAPEQPQAFDRIIIADCLWMPSQHVNLVKTILHYLDPAQPDACALVVGGFHTGRGIVRNFFHIATGEWKDEEVDEADQEEDPEIRDVQGKLKAVEIFEIDANGGRRPWQPVRFGEDKHQAKRWCVCAVLVRCR